MFKKIIITAIALIVIYRQYKDDLSNINIGVYNKTYKKQSKKFDNMSKRDIKNFLESKGLKNSGGFGLRVGKLLRGIYILGLVVMGIFYVALTFIVPFVPIIAIIHLIAIYIAGKICQMFHVNPYWGNAFVVWIGPIVAILVLIKIMGIPLRHILR